MLRQRIAFLVNINEEGHQEDLTKTIELFYESHVLLAYGQDDMPKPSEGSDVYDYFFGTGKAHERISDFIANAKGLANNKNDNLQAFNEFSIREIVPLLNELVVIFSRLYKEIQDRKNKLNDVLVHSLTGIQEIAKESRSLAINTTIAAAHLGEQGNSFKVVGNHMNDLSKKINSIVKDTIQHLDPNP